MALEIKDFLSITSRLHKKSFFINIFRKYRDVRLHAGYIKILRPERVFLTWPLISYLLIPEIISELQEIGDRKS